jgi:hypothetical protein
VRECRFIRAGNNIYVPPVEVWLEGWTRQRWLERHFREPDTIRVASLMSWEWLSEKHKVTRLVEKSGKFTEETCESKKT